MNAADRIAQILGHLPEVIRACDSRLQVVIEQKNGDALAADQDVVEADGSGVGQREDAAAVWAGAVASHRLPFR